ncbi:MAG: leucine-rich repeat domain-containing protein, partial [Candidatus Methanoplasma sp.]|nr:leucine-rich repeat domain-containing protein [Candidatus Methanoplasma sp.]
GHAFENCSFLASVDIQGSVGSIGYGAFSFCAALASVDIQGSVGPIGEYAFYGCAALASVTFNGDATSIGKCAFIQCYALASVDIQGSVGSIGERAFFQCYALASVTFNVDATSIGESAFQQCYALASVTFNGDVTSIGESAFRNCYALTSIVIPSGVDFIGEYAFYECVSLRNIVFKGSIPPRLDAHSFELDDFLMSEAYVWSSIWTSQDAISNAFTDRETGDTTILYGGTADDLAYPNVPHTPYGTDSGVHWVYDESVGTLTFSGTGVIEYITSTWNEIRPYVQAVIIAEDSNIEIGDGAFYLCTSLSSFSIPDGVTSIGEWAFYLCTSLSSVSIPQSVGSIGEWAFAYCTSLSSVSIPQSVESVGDYAFAYCTSLTSAAIQAPGLDDLYAVFYADFSLIAVSIYDNGSDTPTRYTMSYYASARVVVIYYDDSVDGNVYATQSLRGDVTLHGFDYAVKVGTTAGAGDVKTVLSGESFATSTLVGRTAYASSGQYRTVSASIDNGTISPSTQSGLPIAALGGDLTFTFSANAGYAIESVMINGEDDPAAAASGAYTFHDVTSDGNTISVTTTRLTFVVTATADANSSISPEGLVSLDAGGSETFTFSANAGYAISDVVVDGASVPTAVAAGTYTFSGADSDHTISVKSAPSFSSPGGVGSGSGSEPGDESDGSGNGYNDDAGDSRESGGEDEGVSVAVILVVIVIAIAAGSAVLWLVIGRR